jgi:hypothetical protein
MEAGYLHNLAYSALPVSTMNRAYFVVQNETEPLLSHKYPLTLGGKVRIIGLLAIGNHRIFTSQRTS